MIIVQTNTDSREEAEKIAKALLKEKLVSVAHVFPAKSMYLWKGNQIEGKEFILNLKTKEENCKAVIAAVEKLHSYEVPPVFAIPVADVCKSYSELAEKELQK